MITPPYPWRCRVGMDALFSPDRRHRYLLWNVWDLERPIAGILGVNPSTADGKRHDHTTRKLTGFGEYLGFGGFLLGNPFAFCSTDQLGLLPLGFADAVGPDNDAHLRILVADSHLLICAWGACKSARVRRLLDARLPSVNTLLAGKQLWCWGRSQDGSPRHPLMLGYSTPLEPYQVAP